MLKIVDYLPQDLPPEHSRRKLRDLSMDEFIENYGSGTLRKSKKLGFGVQEAYLAERTKFEFGEGFKIAYASRVAYNDIHLVPCQGMTELGWHAERMIELRPFESDVFVCKNIDVEFSEKERLVGAGIIVKETSAKWIPKGFAIFAVVTVLNNGKYQPAINPF